MSSKLYIGRTLTFSVLFFFISSIGCKLKDNKNKYNEDFSDKIASLVLSEKNVNQDYFFKTKSDGYIYEYLVTFIGAINNTKRDSLNFVYVITYSGVYEDAKKSSSTLYIYNNQNTKIGSYYLGSTSGLYVSIDKSELVFNYNNTSSCNQSTHINFQDSIPHQIFIKCSETEKDIMGDWYKFTDTKE